MTAWQNGGIYGAGAPPGPLNLQDQVTGDDGAREGGTTDPVMSLLHDISSCLAAVEKAGPQWHSPMPSPSTAPTSAMVSYMPFPAVDLAVPSTSLAHLV